jgi:uncharacterized membrane protein (UPF0182 family)
MNQQKANKFSAIGFIGILIMGLVISFTRSIVNFFTNIQWFQLNNYLQTFLVRIKTEAFMIIPITILLTVGLYLYLKRLKNQYYHTAHIFYNKRADQVIHRGMAVFSFLFSLLLSIMISNQLWLKIRMAISSTTFGMKDPIFDHDVGFYIFKLPLYEQLLTTLIMLTILMIIITITFFLIIMSVRQTAENKVQDIHFITPQQKWASFLKNEVVKTAIHKIAILGFIILMLLSARFFLRGYELMYSTRGVAYGASYTDVNISLWMYRALSFVSFFTSFLFLYALTKNKTRLAVSIPITLILIFMGGSIIGLFVQQLVVEPDEISKEREYLEYNIKFTQEAYGIVDVKEEAFSVEQNLTWDDIKSNETTISNIRINDVRPLEQTYNQIQGIRLYYEFNDIDLDRYLIDGDYRQIFISAREMNQEKLSDQAKTWINQHLKYTHGYGIVMSPVNSVTNEGQPELLFKNIPPITDTTLNITQPEIYFGELADRYVVINTKEDEFDYPSGSDNQTTRYDGDAGIELSGLNRLLFSIRESSMKLLVSSVVESDSRIILYRNIKDRVKKIAPFLEYDINPYLVLNQDDGKLYWIMDAYTTSQYYPYSQIYPFKNKPVNYIRNSVKVVVDAYNGTTDFYIIDQEDPIVEVYDSIFSDLFKDISEMPTGLRPHVKYPQDFFNLQSTVYKTYHVNNPEVFYNGEDIWDIANEKYMDSVQQIESNYVLFKLPDSETEEFALILPFTPKEKANMTSLFVARNDGDNYGKLYIYKFPKDKTIQGPMMIESRIDQDSTISPQFTLWGQEGSAVLRGNVIVVPVEDSILYVEPIYLQADNPNSLPEMKRVIVAYEEKIVMAETLDQALKSIFLNRDIIDLEDTEVSPELKSLINELNRLFNDSKDNLEDIENILYELNNILEN